MGKQYFVLRYRNDDGIHNKGDIQYFSQHVIYVGQTPECRLELPKHPDYADICYAVIKMNSNSGWYLIRQNKDVDIYVNGMSLDLVHNLYNNDRLTFGNTHVVFNIEEGDIPVTQYVKYKTPKWLWLSLASIFMILSGIIYNTYENGKSTMTIYKKEIRSVCKIEADSLFVISGLRDTLDAIQLDRSFVGTGFVTNNGYFVTGRHCVEFWLSMENELKPNFYNIESDIVKKAIEAEMDSSIHLVSTLKITSYDGKTTWRYTSDDFVMDKSRDNIYDCGDFETGYLWRSVVSLYEKRDAELGDVAVMKWKHGDGNIVLESADAVLQTETALCSFGYPQNENSQKAMFALDGGRVYQYKKNPDDCLICTKGFDQGFSGGPVFDKKQKTVVGIVSRSSNSHTLIVPVSQIHRLINKIEKK